MTQNVKGTHLEINVKTVESVLKHQLGAGGGNELHALGVQKRRIKGLAQGPSAESKKKVRKFRKLN
jgi:hypothetical protein